MRRVDLERPNVERVLEIRGLVLNNSSRDVSFQETPISLTATEFDLLWTLVHQPGRVLSRDQLIDVVYGEQMNVSDRTIDTFVKRIRKKLRAVDASFDDLETVRSIGYRYKA